MSWPFPSHPPALVFSEDSIGVDQRGLLLNVYKDQYSAHQAEIHQNALLRAYGRALLPALWLYVVCAKLSALIPAATPTLGDRDHEHLRDGIRALRNAAASVANPADYDGYLTASLRRAGMTMMLFREGREPTAAEGLYSPVSTAPTAASLADPGIGASGLRQFALGLGLLGAGERNGAWACAAPTSRTASLRVTSPARAADIYFAANAADW